MWETIVLFLEQNAVAAGSAGGIAGVGVALWAIVKAPFSRAKPTEIAQTSIDQIKGPEVKETFA